MILLSVLSGLLLLSPGFGPSAAGASVASSPEEVHPLLPGMTAPDAAVQTLDGAAISLAEVLSKKPTVLVFYRGGW